MCQCRFIGCNKYTTLVGMLVTLEGIHMWEQGESLYLLNFTLNLKLVLKFNFRSSHCGSEGCELDQYP